MPKGKNVGIEFLRVADESPETIALVTDEMTVSYAQLSDVVISFANRMRDYGVGHSSIVAIDTKDTLVSLAMLLATSLLRAQWIEAGRILAETKVVQPTHFFRSPESTGSKKVKFVVMDNTWGPGRTSDRQSDVKQFHDHSDEDTPWLIVKTSGTTGTPKFLSLSQDIVFDRSKAVTDDFIAHNTRFCSLFSCTAYPFITRALAALLNKCTIIDSRDFNLWQRAGVNLVMGSPLQIIEMLGDAKIRPKIPVVHVAGSKLSETLAVALLDNFNEVIDVYASTETNRSFKNIKSLDENGELLTKGQAVDADVEIISSDGQVCGVGNVGVIRVSNPYLAKGYLNNDEAQKKAFKGKWFYPGDFGTWGVNGELTVLGRLDEVLNLGGVKVNVLLVDAVMKSVDGISDAICFKNPKKGANEELLAFVTFEDQANRIACIEQAKLDCLVKIGAFATPKRIMPVKEIPRTEDGRPNRQHCAGLVLKQVYDT